MSGRSGPGRRAPWSVAAVLVSAAAVTAWGAVPGAGAEPTPGPSPEPIAWSTRVVELAADAIRLEVAGDVFSLTDVPVAVHSDEGDASAWTLEVDWRELGVDQRLNLYFRSDGTDWWVEELRTYDGSVPGRWIHYPGPLFRTALGSTYLGDERLEGVNEDPAVAGERATGVLTIDGLRLSVNPHRADDELFAAPPGGGIAATVDPFEPGQPLHCSDILQLDPATAHQRILDAGYRVSWRSLHPTRPAEPLVEPPVGTIESTALGSHGEVVVFVTDPAFGAAPQPTWDPACPEAPSPVPAGPQDPAAVTGTVGGLETVADPSIEYGPVRHTQTGRQVQSTWDASDARLDGVMLATSTVAGFPAGRFEVEAVDLAVTNAAGRWAGSGTALDANERWVLTTVLTGEGAYDGLTAYVTIDWIERTLSGAIFPGPMPSVAPGG